MKRRTAVESSRERKALTADAGYPLISFTSVLAGVLVAYGAFALLVGLTGALVESLDVDADVASNWQDLSIAGGLVVAGLLFLSYLFGGYVAGRMARRAGAVQGLAVFAFGILVVVLVSAFVTQLSGTDEIVERLRQLGLPTTAGEWSEVGTVAGLASLAAILLGSLLGGSLGERWHAKLLARAVDPEVGTEARARRQAQDAQVLAGERRTESVRMVENANPRIGGADAHTTPQGAVERDITPSPR